MLRTTLAGLRAHKLRLVATAMAIVLGVGFVAGTLIFGDTAKAAMFDEFARTARNVDFLVEAGGEKPFPFTASDTARGVSGVASADGRMTRNLALLNRNGRIIADGGSSLGVAAGTVPDLREYDVADGRVPAGPGEAAIDADSAKAGKYKVGDTVTVLDGKEVKHPLRLVGIVTFGTATNYANIPLVVLPQGDLAALSGKPGYETLVVHAAPGVDRGDLKKRLAAAFPADTKITSGEKRRHDLANDAIGQVDNFVVMLQIFAWIAVIVSAFVIYNTFNILIAQRVREMALLRCVGAARAQLFRSVLVEAAVVGLVGAALGVGLGLAVAYGLFSGIGLLGMPMPSHSLVLTSTPVVVAALVGVVVTVLSALIPAFRSTRVAPLAALRSVSATAVGTVRGRVALIVLALLVAGGGTYLTIAGQGMKDDRDTGLVMLVGGGVLNFLAVLLVSPLFVGPLTAALGYLPGKLFGVPAKLAAANARRNPGRAAATTAALMIGVGLMSASAVLVASAEATATAELVENYPVDYFLEPAILGNEAASPDSPYAEPVVPGGVADKLRADRTFSGVARVRRTPATIDGASTVPLGTVDPAGSGVVTQKVVSGSMSLLRAGTIGIEKEEAKRTNKKVGDRVRVTTEEGGNRTLTVAAIFEGKEIGYALVTWDDFAALHKAAGDSMVLVRNADGVSPEQSREHMDRALTDYPLVRVGSLAEWRDKITGAVNQIIGVVAALLGFAILIALIGIMNTLSLSVFERTRESAMVRALGLTKGQLRGTLLAEALLMALVGAIVGVAFGVTYGWITTKTMFHDNTLVMRLPVGQLVGYVALAALAGVVAAVLPARRATKSSVVSALS
jgi:putative ABC transport system permease protein